VTRPAFVLPPPPEVYVEAWLDGYIDHLSATGLRLLRVCPEAYRQRYILGKKERPGEALTLGKAVHNAIGYSHEKKIVSHEDLPVPEVIEYYHDVGWPKALEDDGGEEAVRWDAKPDDARRDGERVTRAYHTAVSPRVQPVAVERRIEYVVPGIAVPVIGYIDVEEESNLVDLKSGKQVTRKPDANWRVQGSVYSAFVGKPTHFHSVSRAKTPSIATPKESPDMVVNVLEGQRFHVERTLRDYAKQIEWYFATYGPEDPWPTNGVFMDYKGGAACGFCGFRGDCVAWEWER